MEAKILRLRKWLQSKGELAFWLFPFGMVIDAYGDKKEGYLPFSAYIACVLIEGVKIAAVFWLINYLL